MPTLTTDWLDEWKIQFDHKLSKEPPSQPQTYLAIVI